MIISVIAYIIYGVLHMTYIRYFELEGLIFNIETQYDLDVKYLDEKDIPIKAIYLYPLRGVKGMEVSSCQITPYGLTGDRNWVIVNAKTMKTIQNENSHRITLIRLKLKSRSLNELIVTLQDDECVPELKEREIVLSY